MLFIALFNDDHEKLAVRQKLMSDHLGYLEKNSQEIRLAGSLREFPDANPMGACWIIEAPDKASAERLCKEDPFWQAGLRQNVIVLHWSKAFEDRKTSI